MMNMRAHETNNKYVMNAVFIMLKDYSTVTVTEQTDEYEPFQQKLDFRATHS